MKIITTEKLPIKSWCDNPEEGCIAQAKNLANLPFVFKQVCLMPDTHQGFGMPIGGVIACSNVVIPNAIGVDIGCGMLATKTSLTEITVDQIKSIMGLIRNKVPVGFNHHKEDQDETLMPKQKYSGKEVDNGLTFGEMPICSKDYKSALHQLGTLGGGNHFIEIQRGSDGHIWFMIHSGSRNIGLKVAKHYNEMAIKLNKKWFSSIPEKHELAFLPVDTEEAKSYIREMNFCLDFAKANRDLMAKRIKECFVETLSSVEFLDQINIHHNYANIENHFGRNVWIHRKGATSALEGELGLIPGSQGTSSYVVRGKGNPDSFMSCSHGAGRRLGRREACRQLNLEQEKSKLDAKGIIHAIRNQEDLEEAAGAYKDIDVVMEEQKDLVDIVIKLTPLAVIKG
jgi:tRNA-splicing ligase RtcB